MCFWWFKKKPEETFVIPEVKAPEVKAETPKTCYSIYSQKDKRWGATRMGKGKLFIKDYGCLITCLGMLFNQPPGVVNTLLTIKKGYTSDSKVIWAVVEDLFTVKYRHTTKDPKRLCIAETNHYRPKYPQHFVLWVGDGTIVDPIDLDPAPKINTYLITSYRVLS